MTNNLCFGYLKVWDLTATIAMFVGTIMINRYTFGFHHVINSTQLGEMDIVFLCFQVVEINNHGRANLIKEGNSTNQKGGQN